MAGHPEVLIVGGGVIGLTTAFFLARDGVRTEVVDQADFGQEASWAGAGILVPGHPVRSRAPLRYFHAVSVERFPGLSTELRERTGVDNGYLLCGALEFSAGQEAEQENEWRGEGIAFEELNEQELERLEPALARERGRVFHLPGIAQVRNPRHLKALLSACGGLGVGLRPGCPVLGFERQAGRIIAVRTARGRLEAGRFLVATGAWTDGLLDEIGWRPGIRPIRGQIALLNAGAPLFRRVLLHGSRYLVPRPDGRVLVGSTEEDAGFNKHTTAGAIADLLELACTLVPALAEVPVERSWAGLRPRSPDGLPFLGPAPGCDNLFVAAGHFRSGIQLSPATGQVMKELLVGQPPSLPIDAFRLDRPAPPGVGTPEPAR